MPEGQTLADPRGLSLAPVRFGERGLTRLPIVACPGRRSGVGRCPRVEAYRRQGLASQRRLRLGLVRRRPGDVWLHDLRHSLPVEL